MRNIVARGMFAVGMLMGAVVVSASVGEHWPAALEGESRTQVLERAPIELDRVLVTRKLKRALRRVTSEGTALKGTGLEDTALKGTGLEGMEREALDARSFAGTAARHGTAVPAAPHLAESTDDEGGIVWPTPSALYPSDQHPSAELLAQQRAAALQDAAEFGLLSLLNYGAVGDPGVPSPPGPIAGPAAPSGLVGVVDESRVGSFLRRHLGLVWNHSGAAGGGTIGIPRSASPTPASPTSGLGSLGPRAFGGLGLSGTSGSSGTVVRPETGSGWGGTNSGPTGTGGMPRSVPPRVRVGRVSAVGTLPPEVVYRILRGNEGRYRLCYQSELRKNRALTGKFGVKLTIGKAGYVTSVSSKGTVGDSMLRRCVTRALYAVIFPTPSSGTVEATFPIHFNPGAPPPATPGS